MQMKHNNARACHARRERVKPGSHLDGKAESGKAETRIREKTEGYKRNVPSITIASSDWLPLFRFPLFRQGTRCEPGLRRGVGSRIVFRACRTRLSALLLALE